MSRQATAEQFGFDFQSNAAIVLMIENMADLESVRIEGEEDIEIKRVDGTYVLAQAKSVVKSSTDFSNVRTNAKKALKTLSEAARNVPVKELIYFTNSPNPLSDKASKSMFLGPPSRVKYADLPESTQKLLSDLLEQIDNPLNPDLLKIQVLPFETDDDEQKYRMVLWIISDFIGKLKISYDGLRRDLHDVWLLMLDKNGTKSERNIKLKKKDIIWPIIVYVTGRGILDRNSWCCKNLDDGEFREIERKYGEMIQNQSERFDIVTKVLTDFSEKRFSGKDAIEQFINVVWPDYVNDLGFESIEEELRGLLTKIVLNTVLVNRYEIQRIKKSVNL